MTTSPRLLRPIPRLGTAAAPQVEIVVPVYNEQIAVASSVRRLHRFLSEEFPLSWKITVADNASTDATSAIVAQLATQLPGVELLRLEQKGRGRALRAAWSASSADVVAYMDVDLSTDLRALLPLVAPLVSGHSEVAIGTRLARTSQVVRGPKRELISRAYNRILRTTLHARFSDAQCGFKAVRRDALTTLLEEVRDEAWFFDTELLICAQRRGLRIHEVPVDWVDDPDSRVDIVSTAVEDLKGVARLAASTRIARFMGIGVLSTLAYAVIYLALRQLASPELANAIALALTAVANTAANRRITFGVRGREDLVRHHLMGAVVYVITLGLTNGALALLQGLDPGASHALEVTVLVAASIAATVTRYIGLRAWVFAVRRPADRAAAGPDRPAPRALRADPHPPR